MPSSLPASFSVADVAVDQQDATGAKILTVYAKVKLYAVYRTKERVVVQYSDDEATGAEQRKALIDVPPVQGEINGLIDGWRVSPRHEDVSKAKLFDRRVADALIVGLRGDGAHAVQLLQGVKADILQERTSLARTQYLLAAGATTVVLAGLLLLISGGWFAQAFREFDTSTQPIWTGAAIGSIGAFFSVALAIRDRKVGTDLQRRDNTVDAALRILIGAISAAVLFCLLGGKLVTFGLGTARVGVDGGEAGRWAACAAAFAAGFLERAVGDLLQNSTLLGARTGNNPLAGSSAGDARRAGPVGDEKHPAGPPPPPGGGGGPSGSPGANPPDPNGPPPADDAVDGCVSDHPDEPEAGDQTDDVELPPASGGVATGNGAG